VRSKNFKGVLLAALVITSIIALAIPLLSPRLVHAALTSHASIYINGNGGFTSPDPVNGGGLGTLGNPFIIENYIINASTARGIEIWNTTAYFVVRNCVVENGGGTYDGIYLGNVVNGRIENSTCRNDYYGIYLYSSNNNTISDSIMTSNNRGIYFRYNSSYNIISNCDFSNNVDYGVDVGDTGCHHNTITNCNIWGTQNYFGITAYAGSNYTEIMNCNVWNNSNGIGLGWSNSMLVENCNIHNNGGGLTLDTTNNCIVENCRIYSNTSDGVHMGHYPSNNIVRNCEIYSNGAAGVFFYTNSNHNTLTNCIIRQNENGVRCFVSSYSNTIDHNDIIQNGQQAWDEGTGNLWDNGYPSGGNYWSDYTGADANNDGIGDTLYPIPGGANQDRYPLMSPWVSPPTPPAPAPVGGIAFAPDKLALLAPYVILVALIAVASVSVAVYWRRQGGKK
jgi:parallel beta-helix repeat protein